MKVRSISLIILVLLQSSLSEAGIRSIFNCIGLGFGDPCEGYQVLSECKKCCLKDKLEGAVYQSQLANFCLCNKFLSDGLRDRIDQVIAKGKCNRLDNEEEEE